MRIERNRPLPLLQSFASELPGTKVEVVRGVLRSLALVILAVPAAALAHSEGVSGYSGSMTGQICGSCHVGGTAPAVALSGPATLAPGDSATYTFTITGGAGKVAGLDVSASSGATLSPTSGTYLNQGEITHSVPQTVSAGSAVFRFTVTAPPSSGTVTLFAAGLSGNGDAHESGDTAADTTMMISVTMDTAFADTGTPGTGAGAQPPSTSQADLDLGGPVQGGCSAAGALPELAPLLALLILVRRRRG